MRKVGYIGGVLSGIIPREVDVVSLIRGRTLKIKVGAGENCFASSRRSDIHLF